MSNRMLNWRILLAVFIAATLALAPAIADARAGGSAGGRSSSMGSRGLRTFENNGAQPLSRTVTQPSRPPGFAPAAPAPAFGGGSFFQRHPFLTGLAGGFIGSWLFGHSGWAAGEGGGSGASMLGMLVQLLIIGLLIYFAVRLFRGRAYATGGRGGGLGWPPRSAGAAAAPVGRGAGRGSDINLSDADLQAFQSIHAAVQEAWSAGDLAQLRRLMTPEMLSYFSEELTRNTSQGVRNIVANVELLKGELTESWEEGDLQYATAYLKWRAIDYLVRAGRAPGDPDALVSGDPRHPVEAEEMWTFVRRRSSQWLLSAIQQI